MATKPEKLAIPLVLPNNCTWDENTGKYSTKPNVERETLTVVPKALDQLREIKGHVCVVSIAGPCRKGKSYILSKAFDQGEVFPLGHLLDPETMGVWLWVVPQKFTDSTGREFTVVLMDSEGIDSVINKQSDDHRIFTLSVLLSSIMIYNSAGVPNRSDLEGLDFIAKLSQRIQLHTQKQPNRQDDKKFYQAFPNFIWLLRDVFLLVPEGYNTIKEFFIKKVLKSEAEGDTTKAKKTAESILGYFSDFDAFSLPPPSCDPEVMRNLNDENLKDKVNPKFLKQIEVFKTVLHSKLSPKKSINDGEFVTGEALAALILLFVKALNTPGTVPNVQDAWETFVGNKCTGALTGALKAYEQEMTSLVEKSLPCEADVLRSANDKAMETCLALFNKETFSLSVNSVDKYLKELTGKTKAILASWHDTNRRETEAFCTKLIKDIKINVLDPVLARLRGPDGSKMQFSDVIAAYNEIEQKYTSKARGAKDVQATVFMNLHPEFQKEMERNIGLLQQMKDFDESLAREIAANAALEEKRQKAEEEKARKEEEIKNKEREMILLRKKQEEEKARLQEQFKKDLQDQKGQLEIMMEAKLEAQRKEREAAIARQKTMEEMMSNLQAALDKRDKDIKSQNGEVEKLTKKLDKIEIDRRAEREQFQEEKARKEEEIKNKEREMKVLLDKQEEDKAIMQELFEKIKGMVKANSDAQLEGRKAAIARQNTMVSTLQAALNKRDEDIKRLNEEIRIIRKKVDDSWCHIS